KRIELPLVQRLMVEERIESLRLLPEIFWKPLWVEDTAQPFEADQPVNRRRKIEPGKRLCRRNIEATIANRFHAFPDIVGRAAAKKSESMVMTTSGFQASSCSGDTVTIPPGPMRSAAILRALIRSRLSTLIEPLRPVWSPRGPRA